MRINILPVIFFVFNLQQLNAQVGDVGICIDGKSTLYVAPSATLQVDGNFYIKKSQGPLWVRNNGTIGITGNLICNDPLICEKASKTSPTSTFIFQPKIPVVSISGTSDSIVLYHTILNKPNAIVKIESGTNVKILDTLDLQAGSIQLTGGNIHFIPAGGSPSYINHPYLKNENHQNRIFGDSGQVIMSYTESSGISSTPANLGITLKGINVPNAKFTIKRGHAKQIYAGNGSIKRYFDVETNQPLDNDSVFISYIDSAEFINLGINKNKLKVFSSRGADMDYYQLGSTNSLTNHLAKASTSNFTAVGINPTKFRVTIADEDCKNPPVSNLLVDTLHFCKGGSLLLDAGNNTSIPNTSLIWKWNTGATSQTITVSGDSIVQKFIVSLRDVRGCTTLDSVYVMPTSATPFVDFTAYSNCFGDTIKIISKSSIASGTIKNYNWQWGDGSSLTTASTDTLKKLYSTAGKYYVRLTATSIDGCVASKLDSVWAFPLPAANFTSNFNCAGNFMKFTSTSSVGFGTIKNNYWNLDTVASTAFVSMNPAVSPTQQYSAEGIYFIKLAVETFQGCKDTITKNIIISSKNISAFTTDSSACLGDTISFINNSVCKTGNCTYLWDFGDGTQSIAFNPKKIYTTATAHNVTLKVMSAFACTDSSSTTIIVSPTPLVNFTTAPVCFGNTTYFTNKSAISVGSIDSYNWNLGNTITAVTVNASSLYTTPGSYNVTLTATSNLGCIAKLTQKVSVFPKPIAQYTVPNACEGQPSNFNQNSIGSNLSYAWDFGNTVTSTANNPTYTYPSPGNYITSLIVLDANNCSDTTSINTIVFSKPNPALGGVISTCGTSYKLDAGAGVSYLWQPLNATTQTVTVNTSGTYTVTVTNYNGCTGKDIVNVKLNEEVKPKLGNDTISCGSYVINAGYPGSTYLWNTGATTQTLLVNAAGTYIVTVTDINNCIGKDTVNVVINAPPTLSLGSDVTQCQTSQPLIIKPVTDANVFLWNDGSVQPTLSVTKSSTYILTVTATNGCKKSDTILVNLKPSPVVSLGNDTITCGSKLLDAQNNGYAYLWSNGATSQAITASATGLYWVAVTNPFNGCVGTDSINLKMDTPIHLFLGNDTSTCSNVSFVLDAGNAAGLNYVWSTGANTPTIVVGNSGTYAVTVTNGVCSAFDAIKILVLNTPIVDLGSNQQYLCSNSSITLNAGNVGTVKWSSDNGFSSAQPIITIDKAGTYWVQVSNGDCTASDTVKIIKSDLSLTAYYIASTIDTVGKSIKFVDVSKPTPKTWLWDFGDGFSSALQSPEHIFLTPQTYNVSLVVSNGFCTSKIVKTLKAVRMSNDIPKANASTLALLDFSFYPNPADQSFKTVFELNDMADINFSVYDITGNLVYQQNRSQTTMFNEETTITDLKDGLYIIQVIAESKKGFVIQKGKLLIMK